MSELSDARKEVPPFDFSTLIASILKHRRLVVIVTLAASIVGVGVSLSLPAIYTGTALVMPPQRTPAEVFSGLGQLSIGSSAGTGLGTALGLRSQNDLYVGMLRSRSVADRIIMRFKLHELYDRATMVDTRRMFSRRADITATKEGLIQIEFEDEDPQRAAAVANAFVEELERLTQTLALSEAAQRRVFFEKRVEETSQQLREAEEALTAFRQKTGLIARIEDQGRAIIDTITGLRVQIMMREAQVARIRAFATESNPVLIQSLKEIANLKKELAGLEKSGALGDGNIMVPTESVPTIAQDYVVKLREIKYHERMLEALARQLEQAKIDEGKNPTVIQAVDTAIAPDKRTRPKRTIIVMFVTAVGLLVGSFSALMVERRLKVRSSPTTSS